MLFCAIAMSLLNNVILYIGAVIRRNRDGATNFQGTSGTESNSYQGYAITTGRFMTTSRQGIGSKII